MSARIAGGAIALTVAAMILSGCESPSSKCDCFTTLKNYTYAGQSQLCNIGDGICTNIWEERMVDGKVVRGYTVGDPGVVSYKEGKKHWLFFTWTYQDKEQPCKDFHQLCATPSSAELHTDTYDRKGAPKPTAAPSMAALANANSLVSVFLFSFVTAALITAGVIVVKRRADHSSPETPYVPILQ
mmetsp:Transcript_37903/g.66817  ORF Transcript_37903/g.66817 Transcript_37903/m.66817 type:complete len:185 (-) Transcript_37903:91-645(-)